MGRRLAILPLCVLLACGLWAQKRKNKKDEEPPTQVLPPLPEPPEAVGRNRAPVLPSFALFGQRTAFPAGA